MPIDPRDEECKPEPETPASVTLDMAAMVGRRAALAVMGMTADVPFSTRTRAIAAFLAAVDQVFPPSVR